MKILIICLTKNGILENMESFTGPTLKELTEIFGKHYQDKLNCILTWYYTMDSGYLNTFTFIDNKSESWHCKIK